MPGQFENYAVRTPLYETNHGIKGRQSPTMTFMSEKQTGAPYYVELGWVHGIPDPNPHLGEHVHAHDEILVHWGGDYTQPQVLGGEIEFYLGGQRITFNTTTAIFVPAGVRHGPLTWKAFDFPHVQMSLSLGTGVPPEEHRAIEVETPPLKTDPFDYEQYVVRSPMREQGAGYFTAGRQAPTMTYMSRKQIPQVRNYIEFGWIWDIVEPPIRKMVHDKYDEIVLHVGGDPQNPEDLGADLEYGMGDEALMFDTSFGMWVPKGTVHGPLVWHAVRNPHVEMAVMLGAGNLREFWADSFFDEENRQQAATGD
jgi:hypothetical protein